MTPIGRSISPRVMWCVVLIVNSHVIVLFGYCLQVIEAVFEDLALKHKIIQVISL